MQPRTAAISRWSRLEKNWCRRRRCSGRRWAGSCNSTQHSAWHRRAGCAAGRKPGTEGHANGTHVIQEGVNVQVPVHSRRRAAAAGQRYRGGLVAALAAPEHLCHPAHSLARGPPGGEGPAGGGGAGLLAIPAAGRANPRRPTWQACSTLLGRDAGRRPQPRAAAREIGAGCSWGELRAGPRCRRPPHLALRGSTLVCAFCARSPGGSGPGLRAPRASERWPGCKRRASGCQCISSAAGCLLGPQDASSRRAPLWEGRAGLWLFQCLCERTPIPAGPALLERSLRGSGRRSRHAVRSGCALQHAPCRSSRRPGRFHIRLEATGPRPTQDRPTLGLPTVPGAFSVPTVQRQPEECTLGRAGRAPAPPQLPAACRPPPLRHRVQYLGPGRWPHLPLLGNTSIAQGFRNAVCGSCTGQPRTRGCCPGAARHPR